MWRGLIVVVCAAAALVAATWTGDVVVLNVPAASAQGASCPGDFNGDGMVNLADFLAFAGGFGTRSGDANFDARLDLDGSGSIELSDFLAFAGVFGTKCEDRPRGSVSEDKAALVALYNATDGPNWVDNTNWLTDAPLGEWYGVETDASGRVIALDLSGRWDEERGEYVYHGLHGGIPVELGDLAKLETLSLGRNRLSGVFPPELAGLQNLTELSLYLNRLTGPIPPDLGQLSNLRTLSLSNNLLTGQIPARFGNLSNLTNLSLEGNQLTGPIPAELGNLSNLEQIYLYRNQLSGTIPPELGNLANLKWLDLESNQLIGTIPPELGNLSNLEGLDLAGNRLTGPILRSFFNLDRLRTMRFSGTDLCVPGTSSFASWLTEIDLQVQPEEFCNAMDVVVLETLFSMAGGAGWAESGGWVDGAVLEDRYGISADSLGRVATLDLTDNGLSGRLPHNLGELVVMTGLRIGGNALSGRLPLSLARTPLKELRYEDTGLCAPADRTFQSWIRAIPSHEGTGTECAPISDREVLEVFYESTGGPNWVNSTNWATDAQLGDWHGVGMDGDGRVVSLNLREIGLSGSIPTELRKLSHLGRLDVASNELTGSIPRELGNLSNLTALDAGWNRLTGPIPPELGSLSKLTVLHAEWNRLTGPIPPELGNLSNLTVLSLSGNQLTGPIPSELGNLSNLTVLYLPRNHLTGTIPLELNNLSNLRELLLYRNQLTGSIPPELGNLSNLGWLDLNGNQLTGQIPPALGNLSNLEILDLEMNGLNGPIPPALGNLSSLTQLKLAENQLTGPIPPILGNLSNLTKLYLNANKMTGPVPSEFRGLTSLQVLWLSNNPGMGGPLPTGLTALNHLDELQVGGTNLCAPSDPGFRTWLEDIGEKWIVFCADEQLPAAYLTQAVQSRQVPVPLVAGKRALLRVFPTANRTTSESIPAVRTVFYRDGRETHVEEIQGSSVAIPTEVDEGDLNKSVNARIPGHLIQPGLEMVIEIDPQGTLDPALGVTTRIPSTGRMTVEVVEMPRFDLTLIPFIWQERGDSLIVDLVEAIAADPAGHKMLEATRTLLPIADLQVRAHQPVLSSSNNGYDLLDQTEAIRVMEGAHGQYLGMMAGSTTGPAGVAGGLASFSVPSEIVLAHELGHNLSLGHAPCNTPGDPRFPHPEGSIGAWGYDFTGGGRLLSPSTPDLMSYCRPPWISDYYFIQAFRFRQSDPGGAIATDPVLASRGLLLWGGVDAAGAPYMEPAFVVDSPPALPQTGGEFWLTSRTSDHAELFTFSFDMPEIADGDGRRSFVFALPIQPEWSGNLASITFSGPGGSATLDGSTDRPMAILRDMQSGQVRAFLSDLTEEEAAQAAEGAFAAKPGVEVIFSRGIPDLR